MTNAWVRSKDGDPGEATYATLTNQAISKPVALTTSGAMQLLVAVNITAITGTTTVRVEESTDGSSWSTVKTGSALGAVEHVIRINLEQDFAVLPMKPLVRVVANGGTAATISKVSIVQGQ